MSEHTAKRNPQDLSKHAALDMAGNAIDYVGLEPIRALHVNWHNVISQSVIVKCLLFRCKLQLRANRWKLSLFSKARGGINIVCLVFLAAN